MSLEALTQSIQIVIAPTLMISACTLAKLLDAVCRYDRAHLVFAGDGHAIELDF